MEKPSALGFAIRFAAYYTGCEVIRYRHTDKRGLKN